jgi:threonylcarbamoyladenosine tRNA methylthiotransferase MtaB
MATLKTITLGCKVNQYETEYVRQGLARLGYREAYADEPADLCVVNTCTVTAEAEARGRKLIRLLARKHPQAEIVVMGCAAARAPAETAALPGVVEVIADKGQLPAWLARLGVAPVPDGICRFSCRRRAYVKVQDGCRMRCTYCVVPQVRPTLRSRPVDEVLAEIARLVDAGHREIVLTGVHLGHYGIELPGSERPSLSDLVARLVALPGDFRVRLSSVEAAEVDSRLVRLLHEHPARLCPHLHLPMQSGSNAVLTRMGRRGTVEDLIARVGGIRGMLDRPSLTTDVIVGFPGETDADFQSTCRAVEQIGFAAVHVFRYSRREGTVAAQMAGQVRDGLKQHRAAELEQVARSVRRNYLRSLVGLTLPVLIESPVPGRPGWMQGTADRYVGVEVPGAREQIGRVIPAVAEGVVEDHLIAERL